MSSPKTISGQSQNDFGTMGEEVVPKSRIPIDTGLWDYPAPSELGQPISVKKSAIIPTHPLDHPGVLKIALSQSATEALAAIGPHSLIIASLADSTAPEHAQGRMILHCLPLTQERANDAFRVATGKARAVRIKPPNTPTP